VDCGSYFLTMKRILACVKPVSRNSLLTTTARTLECNSRRGFLPHTNASKFSTTCALQCARINNNPLQEGRNIFIRNTESLHKSFSTQRINETIKSATGKVLLIHEDGAKEGTVDIEHALKVASDKGYDLVQVSPINKPGDPVCKLQNVAAIKDKKEKQRKEEVQKQTREKKAVKEVQIGTSISDNDIKFKWKQMRRFLDKKLTVRLVLQLKSSSTVKGGQKKEKALEILENTKNELENCGVEHPGDRKVRPDAIRTFFAPISTKKGKSG